MSNTKRPDLSGIPRLSEELDGEEMTAHFAVPQELLEQLREDDDATRVQMMPAGLLEEEAVSASVPSLARRRTSDAAISSRNSGWGRSGRLLNSG